ncbi:response regulator [Thermodesulfobacteriota bacterium]
MRLSIEKSTSNKSGLRNKLVIIETLVFVLPVLAVGYIFLHSDIILRGSHVIIMAFTLILILSSMVFIRQIFDKIINITTSIKMAQDGVKRLKGIEEDTSELHEIAVSFNNLMERLETTSDELKRRTFELLTIKELIESVSRSLDIDKMQELLLEKAMGISKAQIGSVLFLESEKKRFRVVAYKGRQTGPNKKSYIKFSHSIARQVAYERRPLIVQDIENDSRTDKPNDPRYKTPSFLSMPIFAKNNLMAVLNLADKENQEIFDSDDERILSIMISEIGFALENATLHSNIKEHLKNIKERTTELIIANDQLQHEIRERKRVEEELQQSQKMEAIGTLAGGIAHEFNNVLAIILGNAELAMCDITKSNPAREYFGDIQSAALRGKDVVSQILSFARKSIIKRKPVQIGPAIRGTLKLMRASIPTTIEIRPNLSCESDTVMADSTQINQLLMNLCANARDAMREEGGVLEVKLKNTILDEQSATRHEGLIPGNYVKLIVRDTGTGLDPEIITRIFEPYFTTKSLAEGTGMGLAVVYGIVKSHDGAIRVQSELGTGTTVEVLFPRIDMVAVEPKPEEPEELPSGNERILFVDDEKNLVRAYTNTLKSLGYDVVSFTSPIEALEVFKAQPNRFDLVITDMTMPNMTGKKLSQELIKLRPDIPIILCTGYSDQIDEEKAEKIGVKGFAIKPLAKKALALAVRKVLHEEKS